MPHLTTKLLHNIHQYALIPSDSLVLVAVSGGADSMALLHMLYPLQERLGYKLHVATLDHGLRREASAADAAFVRKTAESWGLSVTVGTADLDPHAPGVETRAREARYQFLLETARRIGADRIATAHHADDQAETVLMHIVRGGGLRGLAGMTYSSQLSAFSNQFRVYSSEFRDSAFESGETRGLNPLFDQSKHSVLHLIRPMLNITRAEIEAYCLEQDITFRHDASNDEPNTLRNILRLQTLPHLRELNPQIVDVLNRLAEIVGTEDEYLEQETRRFLDNHGKIEAGRITLGLSTYRNLHLAMQRRVLQRCEMMLRVQQVASVEGDRTLTFDRVDAAVRLMKTAQVGAVAHLPGGVQVRLGYGEVYIEREDAPESYDGWLLPEGFERQLALPESVDLPDGWRLTIEEGTAPQASFRLIMPLNALVTLRTRRPGDRIAPKGMKGHTRKLKEWMIDRKIPQKIRDRIPLLVVDEQIAAVLSHPEYYVTELFVAGYNPVTSDNRYICVTVAKTKEFGYS